MPLDVAALLVLLAGLLIGLQCATLSKFKALNAAGYASVPLLLQDLREKVDFDALDAALALGLVAVVVGLVGLEVRRGRLSIFLHYIFAAEKRTVGLLALGSGVLVRYYFAPGMYWGGDASAHLAYAHIAARSLAQGEWPIWTNYLGCGTPYLQFYGFLFFYLVAAADLLCRDFYLAVKLVLGGSHVLSGLGMYCLARLATGSRGAGFMAGLAYVLCFWHAQQVLVMGRYPLSAFYALLPWPFFCFEKVLKEPRQRAGPLWGGIALGALAFAHPGYAFWATAFLMAYMGLRLGTTRWRWKKAGPGTALLLATGAAFSAYLVLPMWVERGHTVLQGGIALTSVPDPTWQHLLYWSNHLVRLVPLPEEHLHWYGGYMGLSLVGLALGGGFLALRHRRVRGPLVAALLCLALALVLVFAYRPLSTLPLVSSFNAARYLLFVAFFLSLAAGSCSRLLAAALGRRRAPALLLLLMALDLGPTTFLDVYTTPQRADDELLDELRLEAALESEGALPPMRLLTTLGSIHPYLGFSWVHFKTLVPLAQADPGNLLPASDSFANPFGDFLDRALARLAIPQEMAAVQASRIIPAGLKLLNVRHVLATQEDESTRWLTWGGQSPVLVSAKVAAYEVQGLKQVFSEEEVDRRLWQPTGLSRMEVLEQAYAVVRLIREMDIDVRRNVCGRILLAGHQGEDDLGTSPELEMQEHRVWNQRVEMRLRVSAACYARLAYAYYPHLEMRVDGQRVEPLETVEGFICLKLNEGEHRIALEPRLSPLRRGLLALDGLILALAVGLRVRKIFA
jgi:hypothetical protein